MKKLYLLLLLAICVNLQGFSQNCTSRTVTVSSLQELNTELNNLVIKSDSISTTIVITNNSYGNIGIQQPPVSEIGLWRDINVQGGCPCEIKAETDNAVNLYGTLFWRIRDAKNLTIRGLNFFKTKRQGENQLIDISGTSENIKVVNCQFSELPNNYSSGAYHYINIHNSPSYSGGNNIVDNCTFKDKYSEGHYINILTSEKNKVLNCSFSEVSKPTYTLNTYRYCYILANTSKETLIENCILKDKKSVGHYIEISKGDHDIVKNCSFSESNIPETDYAVLNKANYYINIEKGNRNKIQNCDFSNKRIVGNYVDISYYDSDTTKNQHEILNSTFHPMRLYEAQSMIKLGSCGDNSSTYEINAGIKVKGNIFNGYNEPRSDGSIHGYNEVISNKSSGNYFLNNTFSNCNGALYLRCGDNCTIANNIFKNVGINKAARMDGIYVHGKNHKIYNNYFEEISQYSILIEGGNTTPHTQDYSYTPVTGVEMSFNTFFNNTTNIIINGASNRQIIPKKCKIENNIFDFNLAGEHNKFIHIYGYPGYPNQGPYDPNIISGWNSNTVNKNIFYDGSITNNHIILTEYEQPVTNGQNYTSNPSLAVNTGNQQYTPQSTSPAIDQANNTGYDYVTTDLNGINRGLTNKDIGCHEYLAPPPIGNSRAPMNSVVPSETRLYPNPVKNSIELFLTQAQKNVTVSVVSLTGKLLLSEQYKQLKSHTLNLSKLPAGIYLVQLKGNSIDETHKIVKM